MYIWRGFHPAFPDIKPIMSVEMNVSEAPAPQTPQTQPKMSLEMNVPVAVSVYTYLMVQAPLPPAPPLQAATWLREAAKWAREAAK